MCPTTIKSKHPKDNFWVVWLVTIVVLITLSTKLKAEEVKCEILNLDTMKCELIADQNLSSNPDWIEFY